MRRVQAERPTGHCQEPGVEQLREVGFTDEDILHIVELTAIFNFNGRLANALGLIPNPEYHTLGRQLDESA